MICIAKRHVSFFLYATCNCFYTLELLHDQISEFLLLSIFYTFIPYYSILFIIITIMVMVMIMLMIMIIIMRQRLVTGDHRDTDHSC